jgi:hypothetical protein
MESMMAAWFNVAKKQTFLLGCFQVLPRQTTLAVALLILPLVGVSNALAQGGGATPMGWPDATANLIQLKTTSETCVSIIKQYGNVNQKAHARLEYGSAEGNANAVISGLEVALFSSGKITDLQTLQSNLKLASDEVKESCNIASAMIPSTKGHKGVVDEIAKAAIEPLVKAVSDGIAALYNNHRADKDLTKRTIQTQLEAAKWQDYDKIVVGH